MNWIGWLLSLIIMLLLFVAGAILWNPLRLLISGKKVEGVVIGLAKSPGSAGQDSLKAPIFEFTTLNGEKTKVSGRDFSNSTSVYIGKTVPVAYEQSNPKNAQIMLFKEFPIGIVATLFGFAVFILLIWISGILISGDPRLDDPFHLLPMLIANLQLNPYRFPVYFLLSIVIPVSGTGTYLLTASALDLRANGIKTVGEVLRFERIISKTNDGRATSGIFPMVTYKDASGNSHIIKRSMAKPLTRLKPGDLVSVIYPAEHPDQGVVNTWDEFWPPPIFFGFVMIAFLWLLYLMLTGKIQL
ncbi:DUF3592 domain-containing protein [Lutibacter sp.]|uniref:DUF3592 domain-containing protein n=1 Tax=Lutibacter sp. TaxID=1925666 RepID=UPI0027327AF4|nr:DUF3592 domain-containing protein [Lutibacter sp.]MDP3312040.1 DUF3592 domain-containing protein [Lutibacter sp.]